MKIRQLHALRVRIPQKPPIAPYQNRYRAGTHSLELATVAEGVEDHQTRYLLRQFGCDYAQGYAISRPLSVEATTEWLKAHLTLAA